MFAALRAGAGTEIDDPVRGFDRVAIVLDDEHGVAHVAKTGERVDELVLSRWCSPIQGSSRT